MLQEVVPIQPEPRGQFSGGTDNGTVTNTGDAMYRAAQYVRRYCDPDYVVDPPFEDWETELV
ncbi:hypothetical protein Misp04_39560 [Micromonospora sp. NBRC 101691]|nr:hypothetical protein Misp04_39560 [Micromonospora sp. NBRC 101691]